MTALARLWSCSWRVGRKKKNTTQFSPLLVLFAVSCRDDAGTPGNHAINPQWRQIWHLCVIIMLNVNTANIQAKCERWVFVFFLLVFVFRNGSQVWTEGLSGRGEIKKTGQRLFRWYRPPLALTTQLCIYTAANTDLFINTVTWHWHMLEAV